MSKKGRKNVLGLHTRQEQTVASDMALRAYESARAAIHAGDKTRAIYLMGYINGLSELAAAEGQHDLSDGMNVYLDALQQII